MVEVERAAFVDQAHHVGARLAKTLVEVGVRLVQLDHETNRRLRPVDDLVDAAAHGIAVADAERLVDSAGNDAGAMNALAGDMRNDLLPELARHDALDGEIRKGRGHAK